MYKKFLIIFVNCLLIFSSYCAQLKYVDDWREPFDEGGYLYISTLCNDQILGFANNKKYPGTDCKVLLIKNYLTNEITYTFSPDDKLWGENFNFIIDQNGKYVFFQDKENIKLFDVETKKFRTSNDKLKRNRFIYYVKKDAYEKKYKIFRYDILSETYIEVKSDDEFVNSKLSDLLSNYHYTRYYPDAGSKTIFEADSQTLVIRNGLDFYNLKIDDSKSKIVNIEKIEFEDNKKFKRALYIDKDLYLAFNTSQYLQYYDTIQYIFMLLDNKGKIIQVLPDIDFTGPVDGLIFYDLNNVCMIGKNKKHILLFDGFKFYIYQLEN